MKKQSFFSKFIRVFTIFCVLSFLLNQVRAEKTKAGGRNFSFIQISDSHVSPFFEMPENFSKLRSFECVSTIKDLGEVEMPYGVTAPKYSFIIHTGDIVEFSFPGVTWDVVDKYFEGVDVPIYYIAGNHDNTWVMETERFRKQYGGMNYSFDFKGCHFIGLCSASYQEPVPSFGEEVINFLKKDLEKINTKTPVFVFFHHPLNSRSFSSPYDVERVVDLLQGYNVVLMFDGHGHQAVKHNYWGIDGIEGGSPFNHRKKDTRGFNIVYVKDNELFAAYKRCSETSATKALIHKEIPLKSDYPKITIVSPVEGEIFKDGIGILASIKNFGKEKIISSSYSINNEEEIPCKILKSGGINVHANIPGSKFINGAHNIRVTFKSEKGKEYKKSTFFFMEIPRKEKQGMCKWRYRMEGACKATPLVYKGNVYVGAQDGIFYAVDEKSGKLKWTFDAGAEILSSAVVYKKLLLFGAGNGMFFALTTKGKVQWSYDTEIAVHSTPVVDENGIVYFGNNEAKLIALNALTGEHIWTNNDAKYGMESMALITDKRVIFGSWDGFIYCLDKKDGKTLWKKAGPKNLERQRPSRYYGPADNPPVQIGDEIFTTDRGYVLGKYSMDGVYKKITDKCSAISLSEDGKALYLRGYGKALNKISKNGDLIWENPVVAGRLPISPLEKNGKFYICTNNGRLNVIDAKTGELLWEYQASPGLYIMSGTAVNKGVVFTTGMDGYITAISKK
jgi:outer membrane protein assembly factor BamB/predicted phosphodiesterase